MDEEKPKLRIRRRATRRRRHQSAWITLDGVNDHECTVSDISMDGAKISSGLDTPVGSQFGITFVPGAPKRRCQVAWRRGSTVGIKFLS